MYAVVGSLKVTMHVCKKWIRIDTNLMKFLLFYLSKQEDSAENRAGKLNIYKLLILNFHGLDFHIHKIKEGELFFIYF